MYWNRSVLCGAATALALLTGCAGTQTEALDARVASLEARDERIQALEERLGVVEAQNQRLIAMFEGISSQLALLEAFGDALGGAEPPSDEPGPETVFAVPVDGSPSEGPADAKVTIVKAFEFACPFCERTRGTLSSIRERYGDEVRIVYKHFIVHQGQAEVPAQAVCAASMQGKFTAMKDAIWDRGFNQGGDLSEDNMLRQAKRLKLNMKRFKSDMNGPCRERVQRDHQAMAQVGVSGTPYFFINGRLLRGAQPLPAFTALIDAELAKAKQVIAEQGVAPADYYESYVVERGVTLN
ncbi:DsbA family protein [Haliangium ochraceum]|uniref:DSBA oxidoreductase n=1 Tax=Haliangium ochraceum (strain DSM 14365 / JCM 11303 / SMP-2) TaxID=502025 RepID=D0LYY2_HALO1|nr:DsbA family protein [Haliangium ochraceum]ACY14452.1 DSBA oxidoreductase [Haliangium ochraceum DSM 14365]